MAASTRINPWTSIYGRNCKEETGEPVEGIITGLIPKWVRGSFLRNGPGMSVIGGKKYNHVFDGMALLHSFNIVDGKVTYCNKFIRSDTFLKNTKANRIVVSEFGTAAHPDPCATLFDSIRSVFQADLTDNTNINVFKLGDSYYATMESNRLNKIDPKTAETIDKVNISNYVAVNTATAHPHWEKDGTVYNLGNSFKMQSTYNIIKFPLSQKPGRDSFENATIVASIPATIRFKPSYYHSFAMTENYFILAEQSLGIHLSSIFWDFISSCKGPRNNLSFDKNQLVNFIVVERSSGKMLRQKYRADAFLVFHHGNAYEEDGHIVIDLAGYDKADVLQAMSHAELEGAIVDKGQRLLQAFRNQIRRYVLPVNASKKKSGECHNLVSLHGSGGTAKFLPDESIYCTHENLSTGLNFMEMIQINYNNYNGKKYKYLYGLATLKGDIRTSLVKLNVQDKSHLAWVETGSHPSEPIFVSSPNASEEDDGILLSSLIHQDERKISLIVLDARTMNELGRVQFEAKSAVTNPFHGLFVPYEQ